VLASIGTTRAAKLATEGDGGPIATAQAADEVEGSVLASDAFFPFSWGDSVELACQAGVKAIAHPGGSIRDQDATACCDKYGVVLVTTGVRHFKH
jgi:phosphoribosylaminoimidazolecarboxamide formyltransferase / IMP cyclohydrolase